MESHGSLPSSVPALTDKESETKKIKKPSLYSVPALTDKEMDQTEMSSKCFLTALCRLLMVAICSSLGIENVNMLKQM